MRSTWKASPKSPGGDPIAYPYRTQAVVAVLLKNRDGARPLAGLRLARAQPFSKPASDLGRPDSPIVSRS